jgi:hypothetical protein
MQAPRYAGLSPEHIVERPFVGRTELAEEEL